MFIRLTSGLCGGIFLCMSAFGSDQQAGAAIAAVETTRIEGESSPAVSLIKNVAPVRAARPAVRTVASTPVLTATDLAGETRNGLIRIGTADASMQDAKSVFDVLEVTGSVVNLRSGPSTDSIVLGQLRRGVRARRIAAAGNGWLKIRDLDSGTVGYMSAEFLAAATPG